MTDVGDIVEAAVDELHRAFGYFTCAVVRPVEGEAVEAVAGRGAAYASLPPPWRQPLSAGVIGRAFRERRTVVVGDTERDPDYFSSETTEAVRSELVSPIWVGSELWGAIDVQETAREAFDEADARLIETVADQLGAALRSIILSPCPEEGTLSKAISRPENMSRLSKMRGVISPTAYSLMPPTQSRVAIGPSSFTFSPRTIRPTLGSRNLKISRITREFSSA